MPKSPNVEVLDQLIETVIQQPVKAKWTIQQVMLLAILIILTFSVSFGLYLRFSGSEIRRIHITDVEVVGSTHLCPGDRLIISYRLHADGTGKLVESATVWIEDPPKTSIYSEERTFLVDGMLEQEQEIAWLVPKFYVNPSNLDESPLPPGSYRRIFAVSSATDAKIFALDRVLFNIRDDCGG